MKERPILFSGEMVRAIMAGRKTQTRRVIRFRDVPNDPDCHNPWRCWRGGDSKYPIKPGEPTYQWQDGDDLLTNPYGEPGDRLWVRETWGAVWPDEWPVPLAECKIEYRADLPIGSTMYPGQWDAEDARGDPDAPKWKPSIHMPRLASRITLEVVAVRVERVQAISEADAVAEGLASWTSPQGKTHYGIDRPDVWEQDPRITFGRLWDTINGKRAPWASNPWVWVIEFKRVAQ